MDWEEIAIHSKEYVQYYQDIVRKKLPKGFLKKYEMHQELHDCDLISLNIGNTGLLTRFYSKKGHSTVQLEFTSNNSCDSTLLIYRNVRQITINQPEVPRYNIGHPTNFGECYSDEFTCCDDGTFIHECRFVNDSNIKLHFEHIKMAKIVNTYWRND